MHPTRSARSHAYVPILHVAHGLRDFELRQARFAQHSQSVFPPEGRGFKAAALWESAKGTKSRCPRSTASRYATIFRATANVARLAFPFCFSLSKNLLSVNLRKLKSKLCRPFPE